MIVIVDLDVGNFANVRKALDGEVSNDPEAIRRADKLVLPGVGNFGAVVDRIEPLREVILNHISQGRPFLGICLGMQLLYERSRESPGDGLGVFAGDVIKLPEGMAPHIGWNQVSFNRDCKLFDGIPSGSYFYFVHSYYLKPKETALVSAETSCRHDRKLLRFPTVICKKNVFGVQFHPEKSSKNGLTLLDNFKQL